MVESFTERTIRSKNVYMTITLEIFGTNETEFMIKTLIHI